MKRFENICIMTNFTSIESCLRQRNEMSENLFRMSLEQ